MNGMAHCYKKKRGLEGEGDTVTSTQRDFDDIKKVLCL